MSVRLQLRTLALNVAAKNGEVASLPQNCKAVLDSLPEVFRRDLVARFSEKGSFSEKARQFPTHECLAAMVSPLHKKTKELLSA